MEKADDPDSGGGTGPFFLIIENIRPWYASVCVRYASPDAYLRPHENPWNTRDIKMINGRYALYASVFRVTPFYGVFPYRARIPRIRMHTGRRNRRNHAEKRGRKGMHHLMHTPRIPDPTDAYRGSWGPSGPFPRPRAAGHGWPCLRSGAPEARIGRARAPILSGPQPVPEIVFSQHWFFGPFFLPIPEKTPRVCIGMRAVCIT